MKLQQERETNPLEERERDEHFRERSECGVVQVKAVWANFGLINGLLLCHLLGIWSLRAAEGKSRCTEGSWRGVLILDVHCRLPSSTGKGVGVFFEGG